MFTGFKFTTIEKETAKLINDSTQIDYLNQDAKSLEGEFYQNIEAIIDLIPMIYIDVTSENTNTKNRTGQGKLITHKEKYNMNVFVGASQKEDKTIDSELFKGVSDIMEDVKDVITAEDFSFDDIESLEYESAKLDTKFRAEPSPIYEMFYLWKMVYSIQFMRNDT